MRLQEIGGWVLLVSAVALWSPCLSYYNYQTRIPNGQHVPHPCKPNFIWHGVGHISPLGGGDRNPFGMDFARHGHRWSRELCGLDSDNDGLTNGQELGDPQCVWTEGDVPARADNITHPGVCDPWDSPQCQPNNTWVTCDVGEFHCDAIQEPGVRNITLRFPRTKVPAAETTYTCFAFDIPSEETYHLIAHTPYIDNPNVMHHIAIYTCDDTAKLSDTPQDCMMGYPGCSQTVGVWTLGMTGDCIHPDAGFRIGKGAARRVAFQFHWTNKGLVDTWYDSSGVTLYYTPKLRPYDAGVLTNGQMNLVIPPAQPSVTAEGSCSAACTRRDMNGTINIIAALNHMHYLGVRGKAELIRNNHVIKDLANDNPYSYDNPHSWVYSDPVAMQPGDELKITCEFSSLAKSTTTFYGAGSYDEMCFGFFTYFPAQNFVGDKNCIQWKDLDFCSLRDSDCDFRKFLNASHPDTEKLISKVLGSCRYGLCQAECPAGVAEAKQMSACLREPVWEYLQYSIMNMYEFPVDPKIFKMMAAMKSCDGPTVQSVAAAATTTTPTPDSECVHRHEPAAAVDPGRKGDSLDAAATFLKLLRQLDTRPLLQNIIMNVNNDH